MSGAYYNEIDPLAAQWLRNLIAAGHIAPGEVDERSIEDVKPNELAGFTQCHFFAGIGIWSLSLRNGGWPDSKPVWTGSCPCQPFSAAGKGNGFADERHLWPSWFWLIQQCKPEFLFGEQVASKATDPWIDLVQADLEALGYAFGCVPFPAASVGAPHIRDRAYWMANADNERSQGRIALRQRADQCALGSGCVVGGMADSDSGQQPGIAIIRGIDRDRENTGWPQGVSKPKSCGDICGLANSSSKRRQQNPRGPSANEVSHGREGRNELATHSNNQPPGDEQIHRNQSTSQANSFWSDADWLFCRDGKWRPVESGTSPLAHGVASRVGRLRAYGNGICAAQASEFIASTMAPFSASQLRQAHE